MNILEMVMEICDRIEHEKNVQQDINSYKNPSGSVELLFVGDKIDCVQRAYDKIDTC